MRKLLFALILVAPLSAQDWELGVNGFNQSYTSSTAPGPTPVKFEFESKTAFAARIGYSLVDFGPGLFQLTAAYQPKVNTTLKPNGVTVPTKLGSEYWAVGAMINFKALVAVGAGLDYRFEKLTQENSYFPASTNSYGRPWARLNAGFSIPSPILKPFIVAEVAAPLSKKDNGPELQLGIYAGIRF